MPLLQTTEQSLLLTCHQSVPAQTAQSARWVAAAAGSKLLLCLRCLHQRWQPWQELLLHAAQAAQAVVQLLCTGVEASEQIRRQHKQRSDQFNVNIGFELRARDPAKETRSFTGIRSS
jgi:hypothetical protein